MPPDTRNDEPRLAAWVAGLALPTLLFLVFAPRAGIWDPPELRAADLARRVALNVFGARGLNLPGADPSLPTLGDLGRMELPTTSVALSFRVFGLSEAAGRLPMALWAIAGLWALHTLLRRLSSLRTATYGALVLATTPLYFLHARSMLGDIVPMASSSLAFAGLGIAVLDPAPDAPRRRAWVVGLLGLFAAYFSRGALLGVGVPCLAVGLVGVALGRRASRWLPATPLLLAALVVLVGAGRALRAASPGSIDPFLGSAVVVGARWPTFDATLSDLGYGFFPWSSLLPLAMGGWLLRARKASTAVEPGAADDALRALVAVGLGLAFAAQALLAPTTGAVPFVHVSLCAAGCAIALSDVARTGLPARAAAHATAVLAAVLGLDLARFPEKSLVAFGVPGATFPHSFQPAATTYVAIGTSLVAFGFVMFSLDGDVRSDAVPDDRSFRGLWTEAGELARELSTTANGNVAFVLIMLEAALVGVAAVIVLAEHAHLFPPPALSSGAHAVALFAWLAVPAALASGYLIVGAFRRVTASLFAHTNVRRADALLFVGVLAGSVFFFGYYPALAAQLSPKELFVSYERTAKTGQPLGLLGVAGRSVAYYTAADAESFDDAADAFTWLVGGIAGAPDERRFLAVRADELPRLNALYREHAVDLLEATPDHNIPVVDGRSSQALLVSNRLLPGERDDNPFRTSLSAVAQQTAHPMLANLGDQLEILGWDIADKRTGARVDGITTGRTYELQLHLRVLATPSTEWDSFLHLDGHGRRFNADHKTLDGRYPMQLWLSGDFVTDRLEIKLDPSFAGASYTLHVGFFVGDKRLPVRSGRNHDNRLELGVIRVR